MPILTCLLQTKWEYNNRETKMHRADKGRHAFLFFFFLFASQWKPKNNNCSPLQSAADNWRGMLSEGNSRACRRMHETNHFYLGPWRVLTNRGVHLDSPIKKGKWSDIEALYSTVPPLHPLAPCAPWTSPCMLLKIRGVRTAMKAKKQVRIASSWNKQRSCSPEVMFVERRDRARVSRM